MAARYAFQVSLDSGHIVFDLVVVHQGGVELYRPLHVGDSEDGSVAAAGVLVLIDEDVGVGLDFKEIVPGVVEEEMLPSVGSFGDFRHYPGTLSLAQLPVCGLHVAGLDLAGVDAEVSESRFEAHVIQLAAPGLPYFEAGASTEVVHQDGVSGLGLSSGVGQHPLGHALGSEYLGVEAEIVLIPFPRLGDVPYTDADLLYATDDFIHIVLDFIRK